MYNVIHSAYRRKELTRENNIIRLMICRAIERIICVVGERISYYTV